MTLPPSDDDTRIHIREGYYYLIIVENEVVTHHTANFGLSHVEFVKRSVGELPDGAWVGSATKNDGRLSAVNSFTFYRNQLPGPESTQRAVFKKFR
ncbi:hypothetical protein OKA04_02300 [Luteolibacter flavescens]|uniref:Uncharacterized protein n=1 Tax=Luteolibacter flavescens TaxID=1859460 RepID=A0ABT3FKL8_9BACT|nr:hypothetical protein [Luteolibacter flavescens]MCW1883540.1 hypothetical protein [Luteolibacter flavescens]